MVSFVYLLVRRHWRLFNFVITCPVTTGWNPQYSYVLDVQPVMGISYIILTAWYLNYEY
jgi:hypothetical protein